LLPKLIPFDLHVLSTPPAFVLSQNQTLGNFSFLFPAPRRPGRNQVGGGAQTSKSPGGVNGIFEVFFQPRENPWKIACFRAYALDAPPGSRDAVAGMNLPNQLTLARLFATPFFVVALALPFRGSATLALALFLAASLTDWLDGWIARRRGLITRFGQLMDPLADKVLTASAFICLVPLGDFPAWAATLIIAREFLITGLRTLAAQQGRVLAADCLGKHKTVWQIASILLLLVLRALPEWSLPAATVPATDLLRAPGVPICLGITVALTVWSGAAYLWANRGLLRDT
jgi:CDP-diacylglycerol--glycerol-3-phosphate 3-phosphatidyltransferase